LEPELAEQVPPALHDELARFQMGVPSAAEFPAEWRQNVRTVEPVPHLRMGRRDVGLWEPRVLEQPSWLGTERAWRALSDAGSAHALSEADFVYAMQGILDNPALNLILLTCLQHQVTPEELLTESAFP
jgi:hypothetical protein